MSAEDPFAPREPDPKNATQQVQSSLWRNLRHAYPSKAQAGQIAWLLVKAGKGEASSLELLGAQPAASLSTLLAVAKKTRDSKTAVGNASWAEIASGIVATVKGCMLSVSAPVSMVVPAGDAPMPTRAELGALANFEARYAELVRSGMTGKDAHAQASAEFPELA